MVAGTAPPARTAASTSSAAARLSGRGQPVGEQRALQRDDRAAGAQGVGDLGGEDGRGGKVGGRGMHPVIMEGES